MRQIEEGEGRYNSGTEKWSSDFAADCLIPLPRRVDLVPAVMGLFCRARVWRAHTHRQMCKTSWITYLSVLVEVDSLLIVHLLRCVCSLKFVCGDREADEKDTSKQMAMWAFLLSSKRYD